MKPLPPLLFAVLVMLSPAAVAEDEKGRQWRMEAAIGPVDEIEGRRMGAAMLSWVSDDRHPHELSIGYLQPRTGVEVFNTPRVVFVSAARRFTWKRWFWVNGVVLIDGQSEALSSFYQFVNGIGWQHDRVTISLRHMSNANTRGRNRGENLLMVGWRF
ncbi:MAG TPA: acyloxyacyl hydrolase [Xanthomonadaceae bacterium]|nr:acyloxyacyl hydrolase [Xanthomonadaceae bacterium]